LRRIQSGNQDAATLLYLRYAERLRLLARAESSPELARRVDAEDIVQSVFASFFRGVGRGYYEVPAGDELWKLLLVIALNKIRAQGAYHRAAKRDVRQTVGGHVLERLSKADHDPESAAVAFLRLVIEEVLEGLPEIQQRMIELRIEGHEVAAIAAQTRRSKRTVERVLQEFREKLAAILDER
jgi:RNA polymerase sigma-70 factor (ECF subfamily)